jgi:hypothetical protein
VRARGPPDSTTLPLILDREKPNPTAFEFCETEDLFMANVDNPHGLRPLMRSVEGGPCQVRQYTKDVGEALAVFIHDLVTVETDGAIAPNGTPGTTRWLGVSLNWGAAATVSTHLVVVSPSALFEGQDNDDTDGFDAADMHAGVNIELNAGNATTLVSKHELDESSIHASNAKDLKMLGLLNVPNNAFGEHARIEVLINLHLMREGAGI